MEHRLTRPPRRPSTAPSTPRPGRGRRTATTAATADPSGTAAYIAEMTNELAGIARGARQEMLAYFLTMARMEAEAIARGGEPETPH